MNQKYIMRNRQCPLSLVLQECNREFVSDRLG